MNKELITNYWVRSTDLTKINEEIPAARIYDAWRLKIPRLEQFYSENGYGEPLQLEQMAFLCRVGLLAATTHNTVPQRFEMGSEPNTLNVWVDRKRVLSVSDAVGRQASISMGCVLHNIMTASRCYGLEPHVDYLETKPEMFLPLSSSAGEELVPMFKLNFESNGLALNELWLEYILKRKVIRAAFEDKNLSNEEKSNISTYVESVYPGIKIHLLDGGFAKKAFGRFQEQAMSHVINSPKFSNELGNWFLPNEDTSRGVGMRGREFGQSDEQTIKLRRGLLGEAQLTPQEKGGFSAGERDMMIYCAAIGVIATNDDSIESRVQAGRAYTDLSLSLLHYGYATSMHAALTEVEFATRSLQAFLRDFSHRPMVVFRIGVPIDAQNWRRPHSSRPNLVEVWKGVTD